MRVICTDLYFQPEDIEGLNPKRVRVGHAINPGVGFAWLRTETSPNGIDESLFLKRRFERDTRVAIFFIDYAIRGIERRFPVQHSFSNEVQPIYRRPAAVRNTHIVNYVLDAMVVIENSPAESFSLSTLLSKAPGVVIGTYVGMKAAGDQTMLMLLTAPTGIIVCSSAIGVARALEMGLNKSVEKLLKRTLI